jgi:NADPH:quinone reductase-like Zn-dependent oxidoreductase
MKAAQISEYGDPSVVKVVEIDRPVVKDGQVLLEVHAASLNPFDSAVRSGKHRQSIPLELPVTLGGDVAGEIVEVGNGVEGFSVGDKVFGQAAVVAGNSGAFAQYAATKAVQIAQAPANLNFNEAASLSLVGVSALQALMKHINLQPGQKIFITGGAGGIGRTAIQLAKHLGAYVAATASGEGMAAAKALGADEVIDYKTQDFTEMLSGYDAAFDTVGGEESAKALDIVKRGGIVVSMVGQPDETKAAELDVTAIGQQTRVNTEILNQLRELIEAGAIKPQIGKVFSLNEAQDAFVARDTGSVDGKVVLEIKSCCPGLGSHECSK